jgi:crossover junction endodeoxyribonuclease RuvC
MNDTTQNRRIIGIDPGFRHTGWGIVEGNTRKISYIASGRFSITPESRSLKDKKELDSDSNLCAQRLAELYRSLTDIIANYSPDAVTIEKIFVNKDGVGTLKLGQARGIALAVAGMAALPVYEYAPNTVKKSVTGYGHADKNQIAKMIEILLPNSAVTSSDAADALAVALCHMYHVRYVP